MSCRVTTSLSSWSYGLLCGDKMASRPMRSRFRTVRYGFDDEADTSEEGENLSDDAYSSDSAAGISTGSDSADEEEIANPATDSRGKGSNVVRGEWNYIE